MIDVDRAQVMAYRIAAHGLHRDESDLARLAVFDLGVQDITARDTARLAAVARLAGAAPSLDDDARCTLLWSHRGAPHYHRADDVHRLITALLPVDDADAEARMLWQRTEIAAADMPATRIIATAATALRAVVEKPMTKGAVSAAVTEVLPSALTRWCRRCDTTHIHEQLMRLAAPLAGLRLAAGTSPATLAPLTPQPPMPTTPDLAEARRIVTHYLRLHGPSTAAAAAEFVGTSRATVLDHLWPDGLAEVRVDGHRRWLPADAVPALENPPEPTPVRLLPPADPLLQGRDRQLLVPAKEHRTEVWKVLGNPGAVLADGEIVGVWRAKVAGNRLDVTVTPLLPLSAAARAQLEPEAATVATARGLRDVRVIVPSAHPHHRRGSTSSGHG